MRTVEAGLTSRSNRSIVVPEEVVLDGLGLELPRARGVILREVDHMLQDAGDLDAAR